MTTLDTYETRCEQLFLEGGNAAVRRTAQEGLDALGPQADLYCWLALGHAAEDEDDHDDRAEEAFRVGLALDRDHLGLLAGYAELCLRADGFDHPGRAARAVVLSRRLKELAPAPPRPTGSPPPSAGPAGATGRTCGWRPSREARRRADAGAGPGPRRRPRRRGRRRPRRRGRRPHRPRGGRTGRDRRGARGPRNAPVRFLGRHRGVIWVLSGCLALVTNQLLRQAGIAGAFSPWGYLWMLPVLLVDRRFAAVRKEAEARYVTRLEATLAGRD